MINNSRGEGEEGEEEAEEEEEEVGVWGEVGLVQVMLEEGHRSDRMVAFVLFMAARMLDEQGEREGEGGRECERVRGEVRIEERRHTSTTTIN